MKQLSMEDLLIVVFVLVDDWYQSQCYHKPLIGKKEEMTMIKFFLVFLNDSIVGPII
jgi:hypothetical protein